MAASSRDPELVRRSDAAQARLRDDAPAEDLALPLGRQQLSSRSPYPAGRRPAKLAARGNTPSLFCRRASQLGPYNP